MKKMLVVGFGSCLLIGGTAFAQKVVDVGTVEEGFAEYMQCRKIILAQRGFEWVIWRYREGENGQGRGFAFIGGIGKVVPDWERGR